MTPSKKRQIETLVRIAILAALNKPGRLIDLSQNLEGIPKRKIRETLLQVHLFAGFPASIEAISTLLPFIGRAGYSGRERDYQKGREAGVKLCRRVYAANYGPVIRRMTQLDENLSDWIIQYGYGTVLCRGGLGIQERELIAIGVLAALGWDRQLYSHIRGALNVGVPVGRIRQLMRLISPLISGSRHRRAKGLVDRACSSQIERNA